MSSQKIPLFGGVPQPLPNTGLALDVFTPPDKALKPVGSQAYYELHAWLVFGTTTDQVVGVSAVPDSDPSASAPLWVGAAASLQPDGLGTPIKILDGYVVRGAITIKAAASAETDAPNGAQIFGYYYRVGEGVNSSDGHRFIGNPPSGSGFVNHGVPVTVATGGSAVVHTFVENCTDEIALAFSPSDLDGEGAGTVTLTFEDADGVPISSTGEMIIDVDAALPNSSRNPPSPYTLFEVPFGNFPDLAQLRVAWSGDEGGSLRVHGYFIRRGTGPAKEG